MDPFLAIKGKISSGTSRAALPVNAFAENIKVELTGFDEKTIKSFND